MLLRCVLSYCLVRGHLLATSAWTFSRSYWTAPCMSGSGTINHPLRDEPGLKKYIYDHSRSSVNTREVSEWSMGVTDTLGPGLLVLMARCKTRRTFTSTNGRTGEYSSPARHVRVKAVGVTFVWLDACVSTAENTVVCTYSRRHRIYSSSSMIGIIQ